MKLLMSILTVAALSAVATDSFQEIIFTAPVTNLCLHEWDVANLDNNAAGFVGNKNTTINRCYQALYNEHAHIVDVGDATYQLTFDNVIYGYDEQGNPLNTLWCAQSAVKVRDEAIPTDDNSPFTSAPTSDTPTIILNQPWHSPADMLYSACTRFKVSELAQDGTHDYLVNLYDTSTGANLIARVPGTHAWQEQHEYHDVPQQRFVRAVRQLLDVAKPGVVPLVWGGASFCYARNADVTIHTSDSGWDFAHKGLYCGFDASSFVYRAMQLAGIKFPFKTTRAMMQGAPRLQSGETIQPGDMVCYLMTNYGNVFPIIDDTTLVRFNSYDNGVGAAQEVDMGISLPGVPTIADLQKLFDEHQPLPVRGLVEPIDPDNWTILKPA